MTTEGGTITRPRNEQAVDGDHERFAHLVYDSVDPGAAITAAIINGTPLKALCGKVWVPSRDASKFPVCPTCKEIKDRVLDRMRS